VISVKLKEMRVNKGLTQIQASQLVGIPLRTYKNYENIEEKEVTIKYNYIMEKLDKFGYIDEENGILSVEKIIEECRKVFVEFEIEYGYLFGSYAKGEALENSDVDLLISSKVTGLDFFGLVEKIRMNLHKKVDLILVSQLTNNLNLLNEILKDGIKIYG